MNGAAKVRFFDRIAALRDGWHDLDALAAQLGTGLDKFGVGGNESVLDVGCGTGNLTKALIAKLSSGGRIIAVDSSPTMVAAAQRKVDDPRVDWHIADAGDLPLPDESVDRIICFSAWPHFTDPFAVARELARVLRSGGTLHVWHLASRVRINEIHRAAGDEVCHDLLPAASVTAEVLEATGLAVQTAIDDQFRYVVTAVKDRAGASR